MDVERTTAELAEPIELVLSDAIQRSRRRRLRSATGVPYPTGYFFFRGIIWWVSKLFIKVYVFGEDNIPRGRDNQPRGVTYRPRWYRRAGNSRIDDGAYVLAANHGTVWDIPTVGAFRRGFVWVCKPWFCQNRLLAMMFQRVGATPVFRASIDGDLDRNSLVKSLYLRSISYDADEMCAVALAALRRGVPVEMFPESTRVRSAEMGRARLGAAKLARLADVPILPVALAGCSSSDRPMRTRWLRRRIVVMQIGQLLYSGGADSMTASDIALMEAWKRAMTDELLPEAYRLRERIWHRIQQPWE